MSYILVLELRCFEWFQTLFKLDIYNPLTLLSARGFFSSLNTAYTLLIHRQGLLNK